MEALRSEEEQIAALKKWWNENGNALLIGVGLALAGIFGWKAYNQQQEEKQAAASDQYQQLVQAVQKSQTASDEQSKSNILYLSEELKKNYPDTNYAIFAKLIEAKVAVFEEDFARAESLLRESGKQAEQESLKDIIQSRLARVLAAQEKFDDALALLNVSNTHPNFAFYEELKGDVLKMKGDRGAAKKAYESALSASEKDERATQLIQVKLDDLADA